MLRGVTLVTTAALLVGASAFPKATASQGVPLASPAARSERQLVATYCAGCHNPRTKAGGWSLDTLDANSVDQETAAWESVVRKLRARAMPPAGAPRPTEAEYERLTTHLERQLDRAAASSPNPGRTDTLRRLNRTEYQNAIRDLLALDVDVSELLPGDDVSFGFDNVSVGSLSPTLMERYLSAAQKVSRLAVGSPLRAPASRVVLVPPDLTQEDHVEALPLGTRGGTAVTHVFPRDGQYDIQVRLARNRNENVEGLSEPHQLEVTLDGERLRVFTVAPNRNQLNQYYADEAVDRGLEVKVPVSAGPHTVAVAFLRKNAALLESERQPYQARFNSDRHPRTQPAVHSVAIAGPYGPTSVGDTPSRTRIFLCRDELGEACASRILTALTKRAYRRAVTAEDLKMPLEFYRTASAEGGFEAGIETALRALLASSEFLFRIERDPEGASPGSAYRVSDVELASRLSFFLWSSIPDDELLEAAISGTLREPTMLERQVRRMLADPKADALVTNFAGQWLHLRNLATVAPDPRTFLDFDQNLRRAFRRETEMLVATVFKGDRNVLDLLRASYTFLNERLAKHYGVPKVYGDHFRRVELPEGSPRAGLLGHGSILTVTSYATRTSPVNRGKWILENIVGIAPPPPPPNVPALSDERTTGKVLSMRERMAEHRANPACASCHQLMDPVGLAMENFDAIGRWRTTGEGGLPLDVSGRLFGGPEFDGVAGLRESLLARPEVFTGTLTEKLLTFALGRGLDVRDQPFVRQIVREASRHDYRFSSLVIGVVTSAPFQMRKVAESTPRTAAR